ncbi:MAG: hypothetical protein HYR71_10940 [Chloroflexi bacterium]|nr:hypothetical protein [Chloroflexota bacterium]
MSRRLLALAVWLVALAGAGAGGAAYALALEERNDFCASCHTQPEGDYYRRTLKPVPADLASLHTAKTVRCIDCHSGPPPLGRKDGLIQGAQDTLAYFSGAYRQPAVTTHPLPDTNCTRCHAAVFQSKSLNNHYHYYLPGWQSQQPNQASPCIACHSSHSTAEGHIVRFAPDTRINRVCAACHAFEGIR